MSPKKCREKNERKKPEAAVVQARLIQILLAFMQFLSDIKSFYQSFEYKYLNGEQESPGEEGRGIHAEFCFSNVFWTGLFQILNLALYRAQSMTACAILRSF